MNDKTIYSRPKLLETSISRRSAIKMLGAVGITAAAPLLLAKRSYAAISNAPGNRSMLSGNYPDWITEARIHGMSIIGLKVDLVQMKVELEHALEQSANVIEAESRLSDYLTDDDFAVELALIKDSVRHIHAKGLKVVWYIPSLEVITPNGRLRRDTIARKHPDWLQLSFDRKRRGVFYGQKEFNDESAWMCPNSPYRDWFKARLRQLAETGVDGMWLGVPLFGLVVGKWGCADKYCRNKFTQQTGLDFPPAFDVTDKRFRRFMQWRHQTLTEFVEDCKASIEAGNSNTITIAEVVSLDHLGAVEWGTEGSSMNNNFVVWEQDAVSEATAMADAGYDDWMAQYSSYKYFRGATMDRPSWAFCYGYNEPDAQLVMAGAIAAQNNPYELRTPKMTTTVGRDFRGMMYRWIARYSKQIFRSMSIAPVAIVYSERNRDFLDALHTGGMVLQHSGPTRSRRWLGSKEGSPLNLTYMGDYRGLSILLQQQQIPTDIYPFSRVNSALLESYPVLVLPYMASLSLSEKEMLLTAVRNGTSLIVSGPEPGMWDEEGNRLDQSVWSGNSELTSIDVGKGQIVFWKDNVGQNYLKTHSEDIVKYLLSRLDQAGVTPWVNKRQPVIVQPYHYKDQIVVHVLNYSWVGNIKNQPNKLSLELVISWDKKQKIRQIVQTEPQWSSPKALSHKFLKSSTKEQLVIPLTVGINSLVVIDTG